METACLRGINRKLAYGGAGIGRRRAKGWRRRSLGRSRGAGDAGGAMDWAVRLRAKAQT
jgi:hypothetical protein